MQLIAQGPKLNIIKYHSYTINEIHYQTKNMSDNHVTKNSGVSIVAKSMHFSSAKDMQLLKGTFHIMDLLMKYRILIMLRLEFIY